MTEFWSIRHEHMSAGGILGMLLLPRLTEETQSGWPKTPLPLIPALNSGMMSEAGTANSQP